jgi:serine protease Do
MISRRDLLAGMAVAAALPVEALRAEGRILTSPIAIEGDRVLIAVGLNGQGPYIFMIDTGGVVSLVRDDLARQLKLPIIGHAGLAGAGGRDIYLTYKVRDLVIGGSIRQPNVAFVGAGDLDYGRDVLGTLAAGMLTASDSDLDFDKGELRLYPDGRGERAGFTRLASSIRRLGSSGEGSAYLFADVVLDGQRFEFMLDTGAPRPLTLFSNAARRMRYWDDKRPFVPMRPKGIGGQGALGRIIRAGSFELGGLQLDKPQVVLDGPGSGRNALGDGIVGLPLIRRFNLSVDVHARSLWVQRSNQPETAMRYGLSGIWIDQRGDDLVVEAVGTGSPGAAAGVRPGDRITGEKFGSLIDKLSGRPGSEVSLSIERGGAKEQVVLHLAPYL